MSLDALGFKLRLQSILRECVKWTVCACAMPIAAPPQGQDGCVPVALQPHVVDRYECAFNHRPQRTSPFFRGSRPRLRRSPPRHVRTSSLPQAHAGTALLYFHGLRFAAFRRGSAFEHRREGPSGWLVVHVQVPANFLNTPGEPMTPWQTWKRGFLTYLEAIDAEDFPPKRKRAILFSFLGDEGNRVVDAFNLATQQFERTSRDCDLFRRLSEHDPNASHVVERVQDGRSLQPLSDQHAQNGEASSSLRTQHPPPPSPSRREHLLPHSSAVVCSLIEELARARRANFVSFVAARATRGKIVRHPELRASRVVVRATSPTCAGVVQGATITSNSWPFLRDGEPPSATTTTVDKRSLVRQGLPCKASRSRTTSSQQQSAPSRRPMIFRSGAVFVVAPATQGSFVRPPTVAASPARNKDISTEFARVDPGVYDSTVGGLATLPPCSSPAIGGVERCATLRRHSPGPGEVPCPRSPHFLLQPRLQFLPRPPLPAAPPTVPVEILEPVPKENPSPGTSPDNSWSSSTTGDSSTVLAPPPSPWVKIHQPPDKTVARIKPGCCQSA
ncbi:hypothetical protein HPB47_003787 [Ixodes persulcatus]|uniref:Uncharacterized protein n=1 Tax=Ixodes persulcatus TaxID=34615 RepID=A0AC60PHL2_IXOPE|nr:hypothetical protein HPB47_003787 [Ixodes persulcatus]